MGRRKEATLDNLRCVGKRGTCFNNFIHDCVGWERGGGGGGVECTFS